MKTIHLFFLIGVTFCSLAQDQNYLQEITAPTKQHGSEIYQNSSWFDLGFGWSGRGKAFSTSANFQISKQAILSFSFDNVYYPTETFGLFSVDYKEGFDANSFSIKIGKMIKPRWGLITGSIGPSVVTTTQYKVEMQYVPYTLFFGIPLNIPHYEEVAKKTKSISAGVSIDVKIIPSTRIVGLAINPFANINGTYSYGGLTLGMAIGKMRVKKI